MGLQGRSLSPRNSRRQRGQGGEAHRARAQDRSRLGGLPRGRPKVPHKQSLGAQVLGKLVQSKWGNFHGNCRIRGARWSKRNQLAARNI